jgi:dUTP diphosphatase
MELKVKIKKLRPEAVMPAYATDASAACDLCACIAEPVTLMPGERAKLPTGIAIAPERSDLVALLFSRSGMGVKHGITLSNSVGVIDADYRGEIIVSVVNHGSEAYTVQPCDRIAQMMFVPIYTAAFIPTEELDDTERGAGGFGSTGR